MSLILYKFTIIYLQDCKNSRIFALQITIIIYRKHEGYYYQKERKERDHNSSSCGGYCAVHPERVAEAYCHAVEGDV